MEKRDRVVNDAQPVEPNQPAEPEAPKGITTQVRKGGQYFVDAESTQPEE